jgi:hypothetical protein
MSEIVSKSPAPAAESARIPYEPPRIKLIDEDEVLSTFQVTQAGYSWWIFT